MFGCVSGRKELLDVNRIDTTTLNRGQVIYWFNGSVHVLFWNLHSKGEGEKREGLKVSKQSTQSLWPCTVGVLLRCRETVNAGEWLPHSICILHLPLPGPAEGAGGRGGRRKKLSLSHRARAHAGKDQGRFFFKVFKHSTTTRNYGYV